MLGIIIGIAAIIAIVSTIEGTNELIKQNMMGNNRHTVKVQLSQDDYTYEISTWSPSPEGVPLFDEDTRQEILQIPNVLRAAFYQVRSEYNSVVFYNNQSLSSCTVLGIDQYYFGTAGYQIMQGREIIQEDSKKKRQVAVIDESVLRTLFPDEDPIGKTIEIYGEPFTVVGVCTQVGQSELVINSEEEYWTYYQGGSSSGNIYIPKGVWGTIYKFDEAQNLVLQASGADEMAAAGKAAANIMNQNMNVSDSSITYRSEDLMQQAKHRTARKAGEQLLHQRPRLGGAGRALGKIAQSRPDEQDGGLLPEDAGDALGGDAPFCPRLTGAETAFRQACRHRRQHRLDACQCDDACAGAQRALDGQRRRTAVAGASRHSQHCAKTALVALPRAFWNM